MAYDTVTAVTDDLDDNLAAYSNEKRTAIQHLMSASAYAAYTRTQSMTANVTLTDSDFPIQSFSPTAARDLTLPAIAGTNHPFYVFNRSSTYAITVKNASAVVIAVLQPYSHVTLESDGANLWSVAANSERETAYKITPTVSSNDLVLTLTHMDGTTPSASRPLWFKIGTTWKAVVSALSRTLVDGTNWFNAGSAELGTKAIDYFAYVVWDSNSSAVGLTFARIPYAALISNFSSTTTNEKHCAGYTDFTSTDEVANIGRFEATLSLSGTSHLWTVPTYTNVNLIHYPIFETRDLSFTFSGSGFSIGNGTVTAVYKRCGTEVSGHVEFVFGSTSSVSGDVTFTPPVAQGTYGVVNIPIGVNRLLAGGSGYAGVVLALTTTSFRVAVYVASGTYLSAATLSSTVPGTWTTNDIIQFPFSYIGA